MLNILHFEGYAYCQYIRCCLSVQHVTLCKICPDIDTNVIWLQSSAWTDTFCNVRWPLCPSQVSLTWHRLLTQRLSDTIKLVGPIISCEGAAYRGNISGQWRTNPHVQSYVLAMDKEALQILEREGDVLQCHKDRWDAIFFGELGSSLAILKAGLSIDSFVIRYALHNLSLVSCSFSTALHVALKIPLWHWWQMSKIWNVCIDYWAAAEHIQVSCQCLTSLQKQKKFSASSGSSPELSYPSIVICTCNHMHASHAFGLGLGTNTLIGGSPKTGAAMQGKSCCECTESLPVTATYHRTDFCHRDCA